VIPSMREEGARISKRIPGKHLRATLKRLGLTRPGLGWYEATRHTFASQWVLEGGSIEVLKEILGHYSVVVTERYTHLRPDLFADRERSTIPLALNPAAAPLRANWAEFGQREPRDASQPSDSEDKDRSGPVSRGLDGVITPARSRCAGVLIPSGMLLGIVRGSTRQVGPYVHKLRPEWGHGFRGRQRRRSRMPDDSRVMVTDAASVVTAPP